MAEAFGEGAEVPVSNTVYSVDGSHEGAMRWGAERWSRHDVRFVDPWQSRIRGSGCATLGRTRCTRADAAAAANDTHDH